MPTAEPLPDNIRRIAVLVSSVDSATARQLLLHLPTSVAKQVRRALQNLGPVTTAERQRILAEFQSTAAKQSQVALESQPSARPATAATAQNFFPNSPAPNNGIANFEREHYPSQSNSPSLSEHSERGGSPLYSSPANASESMAQPTWKRMDIRALSHFLRAERATVIAVVINQLPPETGVALLQQLPGANHREVLQAIANLQDIDEEAMRSIEEHLAERIKDYEQQVNSEAKGTRRVAALLAAAPPELQETWSRFVHIAIDPVNETSASIETVATLHSVSPIKEEMQSVAKPDIARVPSKNETTFSQANVSATKSTASPQTFDSFAQDEARKDVENDDPYILPFPGKNDPRPLSNTDRSLIQIEFEQLLSLSTHELAQVLTAADSQTVLLALAGASPSFMKQFYALLTKSDAKALASRLSKIGPLKLRDIDEAQRSIAELAARLSSPRSNRSQSQRLRVAA